MMAELLLEIDRQMNVSLAVLSMAGMPLKDGMAMIGELRHEALVFLQRLRQDEHIADEMLCQASSVTMRTGRR